MVRQSPLGFGLHHFAGNVQVVQFFPFDHQLVIGRIEGVQDHGIAPLDVFLQGAFSVGAIYQYAQVAVVQGALAVDKGQMEGARSCGMTNAQAMRYVVMPQAVKNILPAIGNEFVTMVKETSIIQYLGIGDLMYNNGIVVTSTYNPLPCYYISAIIYLALNIILGKGLNIFEGRLRKSER